MESKSVGILRCALTQMAATRLNFRSQASKLLWGDRPVVGDFRDIAECHQRHRVDRNSVSDIYDAHHPVLVGHPRAGAGGGREIQRVS